MNDETRIGFIGIGNMGSPMAACLVRAGHAVTVYDLAPDRASDFVSEHQARAAATLTDLADSDVVFTMLPTSKDVHEALLVADDGGVAAHLKSGSIVVDMSSAEPMATRAIAAELEPHGIRMIDAPVSGGVPRAISGTLAIMIGGDAALIAQIKPILTAMGNRLFEVGPLGCGHAMKALNSYLAATSFAATSEAVLIGRRFGLDPEVMADILNVSTGRTFYSEQLLKQHVLSKVFGSGFSAGLLAKDVKIATDLGQQLGIDAPVSRLISERWAQARDGVGADADHTKAAPFWAARSVHEDSS